jgi:hypothetical protein
VRTRTVVTAIALATAGVMAMSATPASANVSQGVILGLGEVTDDWGDEGPLSSSSYSNKLAVGLWQTVLWAEQAKEQDGTVFDGSDVDCRFGPNTTHATKNLQRRWGLTADGIVGPNTFGKADNNLFLSRDYNSAAVLVGYTGEDRVVSFLRNKSKGSYIFPSGSSTGWSTASYTSTAPAGLCPS